MSDTQEGEAKMPDTAEEQAVTVSDEPAPVSTETSDVAEEKPQEEAQVEVTEGTEQPEVKEDGEAKTEVVDQDAEGEKADVEVKEDVKEGEEVKEGTEEVKDEKTDEQPAEEQSEQPEQTVAEGEQSPNGAEATPVEGEAVEAPEGGETKDGEETTTQSEENAENAEGEAVEKQEGSESPPAEEGSSPQEGAEEQTSDATPGSPVPQSDTFTEGERPESLPPHPVGERLSRGHTPTTDEQESSSQDPDLLVPGTPEPTEGETVTTQEVEDEPETSPEPPQFDRDFLIEKYNAALAEREQLKQQNYQLQHKLAEYFHKKKSEDRADYDKNATDQEQRYLKYMDQLQELQKQTKREAENYRLQVSDLTDKSKERKDRVDEEKTKFTHFKVQVANDSLNSRSGKSITPKDIEMYIQNEEKKEMEVTTVRLENIQSKNKLKKKEQQLKSKEELAEGLHLIDFEQLKIENQTYNEKIEERNEELLKLRKKITSTVQVLTHLKEKLQFVQAENQVQKKTLQEVESLVGQKRDILSRTKQARDYLRIDNHKLRQNCGLLGNESLLRDFEERKYESDDLEIQLEELRSLHAELALNCNQVRRKIEQARMGQA